MKFPSYFTIVACIWALVAMILCLAPAHAGSFSSGGFRSSSFSSSSFRSSSFSSSYRSPTISYSRSYSSPVKTSYQGSFSVLAKPTPPRPAGVPVWSVLKTPATHVPPTAATRTVNVTHTYAPAQTIVHQDSGPSIWFWMWMFDHNKQQQQPAQQQNCEAAKKGW